MVVYRLRSLVIDYVSDTKRVSKICERNLIYLVINKSDFYHTYTPKNVGYCVLLLHIFTS